MQAVTWCLTPQERLNISHEMFAKKMNLLSEDCQTEVIVGLKGRSDPPGWQKDFDNGELPEMRKAKAAQEQRQSTVLPAMWRLARAGEFEPNRHHSEDKADE